VSARPAESRHQTVLDPQALTLAGVYADALHQAAPDINEAQSLAAELEALASLVDRSPQAQALLRAPMSSQQRGELVDRIFAGRLEPKLHALLGSLARRDRMQLLAAVAADFRSKLNRRQGKVEVTLTTAIPPGAELDELRRQLHEALGAELVLHMRQDASILGGLVLRVGDRNYDASVAAQLRRLKENMRRRGAALA
jgi:F-type H+-transporting ATPase subunit delta